MFEQTTPCKVSGCRYNKTHYTRSHKCGKCNKFGHGQIECVGQMAFKMISEPDPKFKLHCTNSNCKDPDSHTIDAHDPYFEKSSIERMFEYVEKDAHALLIDKPGHGTQAGVGQGYCKVFKNDSGRIIQDVLDYSHPDEIEQFFKGYKQIYLYS